jgi:serine/threonine protein kinase
MALKESADDLDRVRQHIQISEEYLKEIKTLELISIQPITAKTSPTWMVFSDHLIKLRGAFQRGKVSYMLFDWAGKGNLYNLWYGENQPAELPLDWIRIQIGGLLGALRLLHNLNCRHGDLKPDNILVFDREDLVIADFGLARIHEYGTQSRDQQTTTMSGAQRYEPPEVNEHHPSRNNPWSRQYDIWSLGCIFLEFIIWLRHGKYELAQFNKELGDRRTEKFWQLSQSRYKVHPVVVTWIEKMKGVLGTNFYDKRAAYLLYILKKVETRMLKIKLTNKGGATTDCRATSEDLFTDLKSDNMLGDHWMEKINWAEGFRRKAYWLE